MSEIKTDALDALIHVANGTVLGHENTLTLGMIDAAADELTALRARVAQGEADSRRLDWLASRHHARVSIRPNEEPEIMEWSVPEARTHAPTLREAFDLAMPAPEPSHA